MEASRVVNFQMEPGVSVCGCEDRKHRERESILRGSRHLIEHTTTNERHSLCEGQTKLVWKTTWEAECQSA